MPAVRLAGHYRGNPVTTRRQAQPGHVPARQDRSTALPSGTHAGGCPPKRRPPPLRKNRRRSRTDPATSSPGRPVSGPASTRGRPTSRRPSPPLFCLALPSRTNGRQPAQSRLPAFWRRNAAYLRYVITPRPERGAQCRLMRASPGLPVRCQDGTEQADLHARCLAQHRSRYLAGHSHRGRSTRTSGVCWPGSACGAVFRAVVSACGNGLVGPGQAEADGSRCGVSSPGRTSPDS
jgi:hypothetical protein